MREHPELRDAMIEEERRSEQERKETTRMLEKELDKNPFSYARGNQTVLSITLDSENKNQQL